MHKVFISFHHANDQYYKDELLRMNAMYPIFIDSSVDTGDISDDLDDHAIREKIRDEYLRDSTVTILLVGTETMKRKHIDWEIYSSMFDGKINKKSGIIVITLPSISSKYFDVAHGEDEKQLLYPGITSWKIIDNRSEYEERYPHLPARIIDNLLSKNSRISVTNWDRIVGNWKALEFLINCAYASKEIAEYDLSRPMRRRDS